MKKTAVLIVAAGASTRLGEPKQLLKYKDTNLINYTIQQFTTITNCDIFVILGAYYKEIKKSITNKNCFIIEHKNWNLGIGSSIKFGVTELLKKDHYSNILITLSDLPLLNNLHYQNLITAQNNTQIIASDFGDFIGVPAIFPKPFFSDLLNIADHQGAKPLLKKYKKDVLKITSKTPFIDIDTSEDYKNLILKH